VSTYRRFVGLVATQFLLETGKSKRQQKLAGLVAGVDSRENDWERSLEKAVAHDFQGTGTQNGCAAVAAAKIDSKI
jgi:hypothetical protein